MLQSVRSLVLTTLVLALIEAGTSAGVAATGGTNPPIATVPAVGSRIAEEPSSVTLAMRTAVTGPVVVTVKDGSGRVVSEGSTTKLSTNIAVDLTTGLARGVYTVTYRIDGSPSTGPEGGVFQFAYGTGNPGKNISTWSGYKSIPRATRLPGDAKREAAFEAASKDAGTPGATPSSETSGTSTSGDGPAKASDSNSSHRHGWLWFVLIALVLVGGGAAAYAASRRASTASGRHTGADDVSPPL